MASIAKITVDLVADSSRFRKDLDKAEKKSKSFFGKLNKNAAGTIKSFAAVGAAAIAAFGLSSIKTMGQFEEALADVRAKTGATKKEMAGLASTMRMAAKETKFSARETAEAGTFLAQAGLRVSEIQAAIRPTLDIAAATRTSVQDTANIVTNIMAGMQIAADQLGGAGDIISATTAKSNTNLLELGEAFKVATAGAIGFGMDISETSALIGVFANVGFKGSIAGNAISQSFIALAQQGNITEAAIASSTGAMTRQQKTLARLGVATAEQSGKMRKLVDILFDLQSAGADATDIIDIFGARAGKALIPVLAGGVEQIKLLEFRLLRAEDAAAQMAAIQMDSLIGDWTRLKSGVEEVRLKFAEGGLNKMARTFVQNLIAGVKKLEPFIKKISPWLDEIVIGLAAMTSAFVLAGLASLTTAFVSLTIAMLTNPITLIAAAFGLAIVVFFKFREEITAAVSIWVDGFKKVMNVTMDLGRIVKRWFTDKWKEAKDGFDKFVFVITTGAKAVRTMILDFLLGPLQDLRDFIITQLPQSLQDALGFVADTVEAGGKMLEVANGVVIKKAKDLGTSVLVEIGEVADDVTGFVTNKLDELIAEYESRLAELKSLATSGAPSAIPPDSLFIDPGDLQKLNRPDPDAAKQAAGDIKSMVDEITAHHAESNQLAIAAEEGKWSSILAVAAKGSKAMGAIHKAFAIRSAIMDGFAAIQKAWNSALFPANLPAVALTTAATAANIAGIIGQAHAGIDNVPNTGTYLLQSGERVVDKRLNRDLSEFLSTNAGSSTVNNNNQQSELNFNVNGGGDSDAIEQMLKANRGMFESMIRDIFNEHAQAAPFGAS